MERGDNLALTKMKKIDIIGLNSERKNLIEYLQQCGDIDLSDAKEDVLSAHQTAQRISSFESILASTAKVLDTMPDKKGGLFYKRTEISKDSYILNEGEMSKMVDLVNSIINAQKDIEKNIDERESLLTKKDLLSAYEKLDVPIDLSKTAKTSAKLGVAEGKWGSEKVWCELHNDDISEIYFEIVSATKQQTIFWFLYPNDIEKEMNSFFARLNIVSPKGISGGVPIEQKKQIDEQISALEKENEKLKSKLDGFFKKRGELELFYDRLSVRCDKYKALSNVGVTENAFFVSGYIPEKDCEKIESELKEKFTVSVEITTPTDSDDVPRAFENNGFVAPVEGITSDYSMPSSHDIDPNPIMAIFYYFFFGMMFSDAGYGILMMIGCGLLGFGNLIEESKRKGYKMFFFCGVSTTIWGILYGSFFGDMIATVSKTFGTGALALSPILVDPVKKPLFVLIMSVAFGVLHILVAMGVKLYMTWREGDKLGAIFDSGFWMLVISGICVLATGAALTVEPVKKAGIIMMVGGAAGLVLTQGRSSKNPILKLMNGILSLYDITSIVGDVLSYSRLMALGLATGVIASVINVLGSLGGNSIVGLISFILISIFGHALNFAINMLGAYVHTNRLQYVEFYQKFYEGGGKKYKPFSFNTKYFNFKK